MTPFRRSPLPVRLLAFALLLLTSCAIREPNGAEKAGQASAPPASDQGLSPLPGTAALPESRRVALLLPLSGGTAGLGQALLNAAQLALFDTAGEDFVLLVKDSGSDPSTGEAAAQAALTEGAELILGPLFGSSIPAIAPLAASRQVPVIAFSNDRAASRPGVYLLGLSPQSQVERVVDFASRQGHRRFAALVPTNPFGNAAASALQESLARLEPGTSAEVFFYDPTAADPAPAVRQLLSYQASQAALLLPAGGAELLRIAPLLAYYDLAQGDLQLLGSRLWEDKALVQEPGLHGGWFAAPASEAWLAFETRYKELYGASPPRLAALAYDAVALAALLAREPSDESASPFLPSKLERASGFNGVDGLFRFHGPGEAERALAIFALGPGGPELKEAAPTRFEPPVF